MDGSPARWRKSSVCGRSHELRADCAQGVNDHTIPPSEPERNRQFRRFELSGLWWSSRWISIRQPQVRSAACDVQGPLSEATHLHPQCLTALASTLSLWRRPAETSSWGGCSPVRRRGSPPSGAAAPAPQAAPVTLVAANETPTAPRVLSAEDLDFATVAEAVPWVRNLRPSRWPASRAKVDGVGPLGQPVFAYLSALEPFVHIFSEGEETETPVHQWLISAAWLTAIAAVVLPSQQGAEWNPRYGGALHQLCEVWLNTDYALQTTISWHESGTFETSFDDNWSRSIPRTLSAGPLGASANSRSPVPRLLLGRVFTRASDELVTAVTAVVRLEHNDGIATTIHRWIIEPLVALGLIPSRPSSPNRRSFSRCRSQSKPSDRHLPAPSCRVAPLRWPHITEPGPSPRGRPDRVRVRALWSQHGRSRSSRDVAAALGRRLSCGRPRDLVPGWPPYEFSNYGLGHQQQLNFRTLPTDWFFSEEFLSDEEARLAGPGFRFVSLSALTRPRLAACR